MPEVKDLIKDFYAKYDKDAYSEEKVKEIEDYYKGDVSSLIKDFYAKYDQDSYSEQKASELVDYYSSKKKDQEEPQEEPQEVAQEEPQEVVQEDTESVSEDGSLESQGWRGEQKKSVTPVVTSDEETFKSLQQQGRLEEEEKEDFLEVSEQKAASDFRPKEEKGGQEAVSKFFTENNFSSLDALPTEFLETIKEQNPTVFNTDIERNLYSARNEEITNLAKSYQENRKNAIQSEEVSAGKTEEEAKRIADLEIQDETGRIGISSLGLDEDEINQYKDAIEKRSNALLKISQIRNDSDKKLELEGLRKIVELSDQKISELRENKDRAFIDENGDLNKDLKEDVEQREKGFEKEYKTDYAKIYDRLALEIAKRDAITQRLADAEFDSNPDFHDVPGIKEQYKKDAEYAISSYLGGWNKFMPDTDPRDYISKENWGKMMSYREIYDDADRNITALSRLLLLNEDPAAVERGWGTFFSAEDSEFYLPGLDKFGEVVTSFGETFFEEITGVDYNSDSDFRQNAVKVLQEEGMKLTEEQIEAGEKNFSEKLGETLGISGVIGLEILATRNVIGGASKLLNMPRYLARFEYLRKSPKLVKFLDNTAQIVTEGLAFELADDRTDFFMGAAESTSAKGFDALISKLSKSKYGKFLKYLDNYAGRFAKEVTSRTVGGVTEEYVGDFVSEGVKNGFFTEEQYKNVFGEGAEGVEKFLLTLGSVGFMTFPTGFVEAAKKRAEGDPTGSLAQAIEAYEAAQNPEVTTEKSKEGLKSIVKSLTGEDVDLDNLTEEQRKEIEQITSLMKTEEDATTEEATEVEPSDIAAKSAEEQEVTAANKVLSAREEVEKAEKKFDEAKKKYESIDKITDPEDSSVAYEKMLEAETELSKTKRGLRGAERETGAILGDKAKSKTELTKITEAKTEEVTTEETTTDAITEEDVAEEGDTFTEEERKEVDALEEEFKGLSRQKIQESDPEIISELDAKMEENSNKRKEILLRSNKRKLEAESKEEVQEEGDTFTEEIKELAKEENKEVKEYIEARSAEEVSEALDNNDLLSKVKNNESINESQAEEYTNKIYDLIDSENVVEGSVKESELYDVIEKIENYDNKTKTVKKTTSKTRLLTRFRKNAGKVNEKAFRDQVSGSEAEIGGSKGVLDVQGDQVFITEKGTRRSLGKAADILTQDITTDNILKDENGNVSGVRINTPSGEMIINNPEVGLDMGIQLQEKMIGRNPLSDIEVAYEEVIEEEGIEVAVEKPKAKPKKKEEQKKEELTDEEYKEIEDKEVKRFVEDKGTKEMTLDAFLEKAKKDPNTSKTDLKFLEFAQKFFKGKIRYNKEFEYNVPGSENVGGIYDYETGDIFIFNEQDLTTWFVTHEALHGITQLRLEKFGKFKEYFDADFSKEITRLFEYAKKNLNQDEHYGLTDIHEFVSEAFGNPNFRAELGKIRDTEGVKNNVFSSFVEAIKNLFKSQNIDIETSVLESIIKATEKSASTTLAFDGTKKTTTTKKVEKDLEGSFTKEEMTSKMDKTSLEKALEKVNALDNKLKNLSLSDPFLITPAARLLLAAVKKGLKVGISLEQAISNAKKEVKKSKEYKTLRKEDQNFIDNSTLDDIVAKVEEEAKGEQQKRESTLEDELNKELDALIEESLDTEKPKTARDVRKIQKKFKDFISANKKILKQASPALNATIANKLANVSSPASLKSAAEYISKIIKDTKFKKEQEAKAKVIEEIRKEIDIESFRKKGGKYAQGKIAIELDKFFGKIRNAVNLTKEEASEKIDSILEGVKDFNDIKIEDQETLMALDFADLDGKSIESLNELKKTIKGYKSKGRQWLKIKKDARVKKYKEGASDLKTAILGGDVEMNPNLRKGSTKTTIQEIKASFTRLIDTIKSGVPKIENWAGLLNHINNLSGKQAGSKQKARDFLKEKFLVPVQKARSQKTKNVQNITNTIKNKKQAIFGKNISKVNKDLQKTMFVTDANGNKISSGKFGYLSITKDQAMYIYNLQKDPTLAATFNKMKKDPANKALIDTANKLVAEDSKLQEYADWVHNDFYPNYYNRINAEYRKQYDFNLPFNENYSPIRRIDAPDQDIDMLNPTRNIASTLNGSLKERTANTKDLDLTLGMDGTMLGYMDSMEHFITHTDAVKFLNRTFTDSGVKNVITQKFGAEVNGVIDRFIKSLAGNQKANEATMSLLDKFRRRYTTATLGLNPVVFIKQLTSAPAYAAAEGVNTLDYVKQAARMLTTKEGRRDLIDIYKSDYVRDRLKRTGFDRDTALNYKNDFNKLVSGGGRIRNKLMFMTKYGDIGAIIIGGTPYYTSMKKKYMKQGMSRAEATEKAMFDFENATETTQQSSSAAELSDLQRGSKLMKLFTMFKTSPAQYLRKGMTTPVRNIVRGRGTSQDIKNLAMFNVILPSLFTWASKGLLFPDEEDADDYVASIASGNLSGVPFFGDALSTGVDLLKGEDFGINSAPVFDAIYKLTKSVAEGMVEGDIPMDEFIDDIAIPMVELRTGFPVKNAKKLTIDNLERISKGNFDNKTLRKFLGYSDYQLGIETPKKEKTRLEKREEQRERRIKNREKRLDRRNR